MHAACCSKECTAHRQHRHNIYHSYMPKALEFKKIEGLGCYRLRFACKHSSLASRMLVHFVNCLCIAGQYAFK